MTTSEAMIAFLIASSLLTITPGLDTALVLRTAARGGPRRAMAAAAGICLGLLTWGFCASVGLGALLHASRMAYALLRIASACYLCLLGGKLILQAGHSILPNRDPGLAEQEDPRRWFVRGLLTDVLNPKVGIFYVTFLPLFIPAVPVVAFSMLLAVIHVLESILWFGLLIAAVGPLSRWLRNARAAKSLDRITGAIFVGFGLRLLFEKSPA